MRLLCDQNVDGKYVAAFRTAEDITVTTVREALDARAVDPDIATYAAANDWVVFTSDNDFFGLPGPYGRLYYRQTDHPAVSDVLAAIRVIRDSYADHSEIVEVVPGNWV